MITNSSSSASVCPMDCSAADSSFTSIVPLPAAVVPGRLRIHQQHFRAARAGRRAERTAGRAARRLRRAALAAAGGGSVLETITCAPSLSKVLNALRHSTSSSSLSEGPFMARCPAGMPRARNPACKRFVFTESGVFACRGHRRARSNAAARPSQTARQLRGGLRRPVKRQGQPTPPHNR